MKTLFIGGFFAEPNEKEVQRHSRKPVEYSANNHQKKILQGLKTIDTDLLILSAPSIGSYPNASDILVFDGFEQDQNECKYVGFINLWGLRNISRYQSLNKEVKVFLEQNRAEEIHIIVYSVHTPFVQAAVEAKKLHDRVKITLIIPDLPQYMHLDGNPSLIYKVGKWFDIRKLNKLNKKVDAYVLLTEKMKGKIDTRDCPCLISEGIIESSDLNTIAKSHVENNIVTILYTGKTYVKFGVKNLVDAFLRINKSNYRLVICGAGDCDEYILEKCKVDSRISFLGQVSPQEVKRRIREADVLVNPRPNNEEYTKYSFPSKNLEYLCTGNSVVLYLLDGMKEQYKEFCFIPEDTSIDSLAKTIIKAAETENIERYRMFLEYANTLKADYVCKEMMEMVKMLDVDKL